MMGMSFNWVDIFMAVLVAIIVFKGMRGGIVAELIKLFGVVCAIFVTLHYYSRFSEFLLVQFFGKDVSIEFFAFSFLAILIFVIFFFITKGWVMILRLKSYPVIDRWGGMILSLVRAYFVCGLMFLGLFLVEHSQVTPMAQRATSRYVFHAAAVDLYEVCHTILVTKIFPDEEINEEVFTLIGEKKK